MNQLEAINYVFSSLLKKFSELSDFYEMVEEELNEMIDNDENHFENRDDTSNFLILINDNVKYLADVCHIISEHLTRPDPTALTDFVKVCDELQKILPKTVDDSAENDIFEQENS